MRTSRKRRLTGRRPSPALVVSIIALVMATAGTATAARVLINSSSQIKNGAVAGADIRDGAVSTKDLKDNAVTGSKVRNGTIGADDLEGPVRATLQASETQALEGFRKSGPEGQAPDTMARVATLGNIPPGVYAIFAKTIITGESQDNGLLDAGQTSTAHCVLDAGGDKDDARALLATPGSNAPGVVNLQITRAFGSTGTAALDCTATATPWRASDTSIIAIRVGKAPRQPISG